MNRKDLEAFAREAAKHMKTEKDLSDFSQMFTKVTIEAALNGELDAHLGYEKPIIPNNISPHLGSAQHERNILVAF